MTPEQYRDLYNEEVSRHEKTLSGYRQHLLKELADFPEGTQFESTYKSCTIRMAYWSDQYIHSDYFLDPHYIEESVMYLLAVEHHNKRVTSVKSSQRQIKDELTNGSWRVISKGDKIR